MFTVCSGRRPSERARVQAASNADRVEFLSAVAFSGTVALERAIAWSLEAAPASSAFSPWRKSKTASVLCWRSSRGWFLSASGFWHAWMFFLAFFCLVEKIKKKNLGGGGGRGRKTARWSASLSPHLSLLRSALASPRKRTCSLFALEQSYAIS